MILPSGCNLVLSFLTALLRTFLQPCCQQSPVTAPALTKVVSYLPTQSLFPTCVPPGLLATLDTPEYHPPHKTVGLGWPLHHGSALVLLPPPGPIRGAVPPKGMVLSLILFNPYVHSLPSGSLSQPHYPWSCLFSPYPASSVFIALVIIFHYRIHVHLFTICPSTKSK